MRNRSVLVTFVLAAIAVAIGIALGLTIHWFPAQASSQAHTIDTLYDVLVIVSVPIFVLVAGVVLFSVWRFRMRPGDEQRDGPPIHGNTKLEVLWTAFPAVLLISLCSYAYVVLVDFEKKPSGGAHEMNVDVTGQQFEWKFSYPDAPAGGAPVQATQLYLPQGQPVRFHVRSLDVIHAFYVPAFRLQIDAVPGQTTDLRATPTRLGTYVFVCAELCGLGHSTMRTSVHVVTPSAFHAWLRSQRQAGGQGPPSVPAAGGPGARPAQGARASAGGHSVTAPSGGGGAADAGAHRADTLAGAGPPAGS
jgi:cytochrome c oxidase subunit 2